MTEEKKPDCVLTDGREVYFDFTKVNAKEFRETFDVFRTSFPTGDEKKPLETRPSIMSRLTGIPDSDIEGSNAEDLRILEQLMYKAFRRPLAQRG